MARPPVKFAAGALEAPPPLEAARLAAAAVPAGADMKPAVQDFFTAMAAEKGASAHTIRAYGVDLRRYFEFLCEHLGRTPGKAAMAALTLTDLRAFMAAERRQGLSNRTLARRAAALRTLHKFLEKRHGIPGEAAGLLATPKIGRRVPKPVSPGNAERLMEGAGQTDARPWVQARNVALITLLYGCGLRISEALSLNASDLHKDELGDSVTITGKGGKQRVVPVLPVVNAAMARYVALCPFPLQDDDTPLFMGVRGGRFTTRQARGVMQFLRSAMGLPETTSPHALRHAFATQLLSGGGDLRAIQELMGHASLTATQIYTEVDAARLTRAYKSAHPLMRKK